MTYKQGGNKDEKEISADLAGTAMAAMVLAGCGEKTMHPGKMQRQQKVWKIRKTFTVGFDAEYPPYGYMDENGEYTGFDLELAEAVCKLEGWELVKNRSTGIPKTWNLIPVRLTASGMDLP